ncbi:signal transducer and activator of transcription 5B [Lingula anatina]|uniref:Signal transducer and activator of transcription n=1 Tax=Lingula anatina TaxID=7574 RepID=A0A2R2MRM9_LINAN|nr:signal transducer and activator of transcription 5B [Lingula anatina]|eukprot:XP_023932909.1 signal transducer and activator of transcription 5B [Lingula anatina]
MSSEDMFLVKMRLQETAAQFREMYGNSPLNLVRVVKNCINTEMKMVAQAENAASGLGDLQGQQDKHRITSQQLEFLQKRTQETDNELKQLQHKQESFIIQYQDSVKINSQLQQVVSQPNTPNKTEHEMRLKRQKEGIECELSRKAQELLQLRLALADKHHDTFKHLQNTQQQVLDHELIEWKRRQQLAGNGASFEGNLDSLQSWCEALAELIWYNRQQIKKVELLRAQLPIDVPPSSIDLLPALNNTITGLLSSLVTSTFIIEKQPPQVLKKESRFTSTVRLLVGGKLNVHMNPPTVKATIISESQARSLLKNDKNLKNESSGEILNNQGTMEYHQSTGNLSVTFRNMQLKRIKRADRKGTEAVTEEKFSILFQSQFTVGGGELVFQVWTLSLPVVVTVHGNQECNALATVLWDNQFAEPGRIPFLTPDTVSWPLLAEMLSTKFRFATGGGLTAQNLSYLAQKIFGYQSDDYTACRVSWSQFNKETLQGRNFTFWEWFYAVLKLTKEHLRGPWCDGYILGFISKSMAQEMLLSNRQNGTFLLRFSDSEIGGITIAWVADDPQKPDVRQVWNLAPFTTKDFAIRALADRIKDLPNLQFLHPNIPKDQCFGKYWTNTNEGESKITKDGYVQTQLVTHVPGMHPQPMAPMSFDNPQTPQMEMPHSPPATAMYGDSQTYGNRSALELDDGAMDGGMEDMMFNVMDYNPDDIDQINVNELLYPAGGS